MNDTDILSIHNDILSTFEKKKSNLDNYKKYLIKLNETLFIPDISYRIKNKLELNKIHITSQINDIERNSSYNYYRCNRAVCSYKVTR